MDHTRDRRTQTHTAGDELLPILAAAAVLALIAWAMPTSVTLAKSHSLPKANAAALIVGTAKVAAEDRLGDPRSAYPAAARPQMPASRAWWLAALGPLALLAGGGLLTWRRYEPTRARARLGRRRYDPRGSEPRDWGRPRDLGEMIVRRRAGNRMTIGRIDRRLVAADPEAHVALVAPTRAGKTTRFVIPWLLEHDGPAIVTSTKRDVFVATAAWRSRLGRVFVWDPGKADSTCWTPLDGCHAWGRAIQQGRWLSDAIETSGSDSHAAQFWNGEGAKLLAPLLNAAALGEHGMESVLEWIDTQAVDEPAEILGALGEPAAARQLQAFAQLDSRTRSSVYLSASALLSAYRHPDVIATARPGFRPDDFLDGGAHTLYICAPARRQRELAPLVVALLSSVLDAAAIRSTPLDPTLRVLLDEAANIAPLRDLPAHLSQASGHGVRLATVWQDVAQIRARYRESADSILANSWAKIFMGPITDDSTRSYVTELLGQHLERRATDQPSRPKANAQALQQLGGDRTLMIAGHLPPAIVSTEPYWRARELSSRSP